MRYIEALEEFEPDGENGYSGWTPSIFLAGGITGCSDWQQELTEQLKNEKVILLNPRRKNFPVEDPDAAYEQIKWEYDHLRKATAISFWFPKETMCPIVLFELGTWVVSKKTIFVGLDREYKREQDVKIQTVLARGDTAFCYSIEVLSQQIKKFLRKV